MSIERDVFFVVVGIEEAGVIGVRGSLEEECPWELTGDLSPRAAMTSALKMNASDTSTFTLVVDGPAVVG